MKFLYSQRGSCLNTFYNETCGDGKQKMRKAGSLGAFDHDSRQSAHVFRRREFLVLPSERQVLPSIPSRNSFILNSENSRLNGISK